MTGAGRRVVAILAATLLAALALAPAAGAAPLPRGFFGVVPQGELAGRDFGRMQGVVGSLRVAVYWPAVEPARGELDFSALDAVVTGAAARGIEVLPFVYGSPGWLTADPAESPLRAAGGGAAWSSFLAALVDRYGPRGSVWRDAGRRLPIRAWQIWNEPNFPLFWRPRPSAPGYARLLKRSAATLRALDPGATVIAAGVAPVEDGPLPWRYLASLYRVPGVRRAFDVAALHPYSSSLAGVEYEIRRTRRVMARAGDGRTRLLIGELGVASAAEVPTAFDLGRTGQARYVERALRLLLERRRAWRLAGVDWFSWQDAPAWERSCSFCQYSGLVDVGGQPKPSWSAFKRFVKSVR